MGMLPGVAKMKDQLASANLDDKFVKRQRAIISSMTPLERRNPELLKASRKKRIAAGAGVTVELVNRLLKQHRQMADMMKMMGGPGGKRGMMGKLGQMMGMGGGMAMPTPEQIEAMQKQIGGGAPPRASFRTARDPRRAAARRLQPAAAVPRPRRRPEAAGLRGRLQPVREEEVSQKALIRRFAPPSPASGRRDALPLLQSPSRDGRLSTGYESPSRDGRLSTPYESPSRDGRLSTPYAGKGRGEGKSLRSYNAPSN